MTTCSGKSCSFGLLWVSFAGVCLFVCVCLCVCLCVCGCVYTSFPFGFAGGIWFDYTNS